MHRTHAKKEMSNWRVNIILTDGAPLRRVPIGTQCGYRAVPPHSPSESMGQRGISGGTAQRDSVSNVQPGAVTVSSEGVQDAVKETQQHMLTPPPANAC